MNNTEETLRKLIETKIKDTFSSEPWFRFAAIGQDQGKAVIELGVDENKVEELERLRSRAICHIFPLPNDIFTEIILGSRWATRRVQENVYTAAKEKMPDASEKDLLEVVFRSRLSPQNPAGNNNSD